MSYGLCVALGLALAFAAQRFQRDDRPELAPHRQALLLAAVIGAVAGAYLLELPADLFGWTWRPPLLPRDALPLGGRTVLGGLIGGWLLVEAVKWRRGIHGATGDRFALPLALALTSGRIGCWLAGCCAGRVCGQDWESVAIIDATGAARYPVQALEALFHAGVAVTLGLLAWRDRARPDAPRVLAGQRLAAYLTIYAVMRFALEWLRENPPLPHLGLTWYQLLAAVLFALAGSTWLARNLSARRDCRAASSRQDRRA